MGVNRRALLAASAGAVSLARPALAQRGSGEVIVCATGGLMERSVQEHFYRRFEREQ